MLLKGIGYDKKYWQFSCNKCGRLAQLARASGLHPEGHRFDSYSAHHLQKSPAGDFFSLFFYLLLFGPDRLLID